MERNPSKPVEPVDVNQTNLKRTPMVGMASPEKKRGNTTPVKKVRRTSPSKKFEPSVFLGPNKNELVSLGVPEMCPRNELVSLSFP